MENIPRIEKKLEEVFKILDRKDSQLRHTRVVTEKLYIELLKIKKHNMETLKSRKFIMAIVGILLCLVWAIFKLEKEYLLLALGFTGVYVTGNVVQKFSE